MIENWDFFNISNFLKKLKIHKFAFILETEIEQNRLNLVITYIVNVHSKTFFNIFVNLKFGTCLNIKKISNF